ncbi:glucosaminidase domain-containing protein [Granulicoccus phenolivorans]|uniref:glucosaminidase domain-containing protein n=1 Tax=Granulicoccus phenolivorans TaxID=266854 RepID=UPI0003FD088E|nr:glucosaminidase domain-containing protein [Granulicoccus phenolivorans]
MSTRASRLRIRLVVLIVLVVAVVVAIVAVRAWTSGRDAELRRGDTGPRVTALQYLLTAQKFDVPITGTFGSQTQSALQAYEQANGLSGDGAGTKEVLARIGVDAGPGDTGRQVKALQTLLTAQGHQVAVEQVFNAATVEALHAFQQQAGLPTSDRVDRQTWSKLFEGISDKLPAESESDQFIATLVPYAQQSQRDYGVPAAIALAQATQETGYGRSAPGNNYFGVKCHNQSSPVVVACENRKTTEWVNGQQVEATEPFRSYASMKDSVTDYAGFLKQNSRYAPAFAANGDADAFARGLQNAGYATDPNYAESLITLMKANDYYRYNVS